jgi:hypothetical protein
MHLTDLVRYRAGRIVRTVQVRNAPSQPENGPTLWQLSTKFERGIVVDIVARLNLSSRASLRLVNLASRQLLNSCETCVRIRHGAPPTTTKLAAIFPNADRLQLDGVGPWAITQLAFSSDAFLRKFAALRMDPFIADAGCRAQVGRSIYVILSDSEIVLASAAN